MFYEGHFFELGAAASDYAFLRMSRALRVLGQRWLGLALASFFGDFTTLEMEPVAQPCQSIAGGALRCVRLGSFLLQSKEAAVRTLFYRPRWTSLFRPDLVTQLLSDCKEGRLESPYSKQEKL